MDLTSFLAAMTWQDWATVAGVVFGIIGLIAFADQRRAAAETKVLVEFAERHVDKQITEENILALAAQRQKLQKEISDQLPILARTAVLREKMTLHANAAAEHYNRWKQVVDELGQSVGASALDPLIGRAISTELVPAFEHQQKKEALRSRVTILSVAIAVSGTILPFPLSDALVYALSMPLVLSALHLAAVERMVTARQAKWAIYLMIAAIFVMCIGVASTILILESNEGAKILAYVLFAIGTSIGIAFVFLRRRVFKYVETLPWPQASVPI